MSCREYVRLCAEGRSGEHAARAHADACPSCARLTTGLETPATEVRTDAALEHILGDLTPVRPISAPAVLALQIAGLAVVVIGLAAALKGTGGWRALDPAQAAVIFSIGAIGLFGAALVSGRLMIPGTAVPFRPGVLALAVVPALVAAVGALLPHAQTGRTWSAGPACLALACVLAGLTFWLVRRVMKQGAVTAPGAAGLSSGILAGMTGFLAQEVYCPITDAIHTSVFHLATILLLIAAGILLAQRDHSPHTSE